MKRKTIKPTVLAVTRTRKLVSNMLQLQFGFLYHGDLSNITCFRKMLVLKKNFDICIERLAKDDIIYHDIPFKKAHLMSKWRVGHQSHLYIGRQESIEKASGRRRSDLRRSTRPWWKTKPWFHLQR